MRLSRVQLGARVLCLLVVSFFSGWTGAWAQATPTDSPFPQASQFQQQSPSDQGTASSLGSDSDSDDALSVFPHSESSRYWISGQANIILQWHPSFPARYSGKNSLHRDAENATSKVYTLYLGYELTPTTEIYVDIESAGGRGISDALGLAGFTNLDVVRNPDLGPTPYLARAMIRQVIPLSSEKVPQDRGATTFTLANSVPVRRIEIRAGKFSMVDFFDTNTWGSDSHLQFLNWTTDNNGTYDYAANTRGYTDGVVIEYDDHWFSARFAEVLMPKVANGFNLDADVARSRAENLEFDITGNRLWHRSGTLRFLTYLNHADMGNYEQAIEDYLHGQTATPDLVATRRPGRHKYGFGINVEQEIAEDAGVFGRLGWSDGRNESFAYTEDDRTLELGGFVKGTRWKRHNDRAGVAFAVNGIVAAHQQYLALGGLGFLLGDGGLTDGPEKVFEGFLHRARVARSFYFV